MEEKLKKGTELAYKLYTRARAVEARRLSGIARLKRFSLFARILCYNRFNGIRWIIKVRELDRTAIMTMALGIVKEIKLIRRKMRRNQQ